MSEPEARLDAAMEAIKSAQEGWLACIAELDAERARLAVLREIAERYKGKTDVESVIACHGELHLALAANLPVERVAP